MYVIMIDYVDGGVEDVVVFVGFYCVILCDWLCFCGC